MFPIVFHFFIGLFVSFIACIPIGAPQLAVIRISITDGMKGVVWFSVANELMEFIYSYIGIIFSKEVQANPSIGNILNWFSILTFMVVGIFYIIKKQKDHHELKLQRNNFLSGILIGIFNPVVLIFWVVSTTILIKVGWINLTASTTFTYVLGLCLGSFLAYMTFGYFAIKINNKLKLGAKAIDLITGITLVALALFDFLYVNFKSSIRWPF